MQWFLSLKGLKLFLLIKIVVFIKNIPIIAMIINQQIIITCFPSRFYVFSLYSGMDEKVRIKRYLCKFSFSKNKISQLYNNPKSLCL